MGNVHFKEFVNNPATPISVSITGDWQAVMDIINNLNTNFRAYAIDLMTDQANRLKEAIIDEAFNLTGKPYDPRRPENTGVWWMETMELLDNIEVKSVRGAETSFFVGFGDGDHSAQYPNSEPISYAEIAQKNEENHPLIARVWDKLEPVFLKEWDDFVNDAIHGRRRHKVRW